MSTLPVFRPSITRTLSPALSPVLGPVLARVLAAMLAVLTVLTVLTVSAGSADAHVSVQPSEVEPGSYAVAAFRVPNERDNASTTKVEVRFPEDQPVASVRTTPIPGWSVTTRTRKLETPLDQDGRQISEVVSAVTWAATGDGVGPGQFQDFAVSLGPLPSSGEMVFKAFQTYDDGKQVNWNEVSLDDSVEPEHPAPTLRIAAAAAPADATTGSGPTAGGSGSGTGSDSTTGEEPAEASETDSVLPLVLSGLALLISIAALGLVFRRRDTGPDRTST